MEKWVNVFSPKTELVKLNTALWLPIFDFGRQYRLDMSKYVWKTPHTIYFCTFWIFECISLMYTTINQNGWSAKYIYVPHAINSWQFLQGKKTTYWMYFGLYIRWKFRKHYGKHSGHGSVHLWHHSGISLFLFLLCSSETRKPVNKLLFDHSWELEFSHQKRGACHWYLWQILLPLFHQKLFADLARCSGCLLPPLAVYQWSIVSYQHGFLEY